MSTYSVSIDGKEFAVSIDAYGAIGVDGYDAEVIVKPASDGTYSVLIGNVSTEIMVNRHDNEYQVLLSNNQVDVRVETQRDLLLKKYTTSSNSTSRRYEIHAPMPALVVKVEVSVGEEVREGQGLLILEAMKMENEIKCNQAGTVKEILVSKGKPVDKGELLMRLE